MKAIADLTGECAQIWPHPGDVDRHVGMRNWPGIKEWRHKREFVELSLILQFRRVLPRVPDGAYRQDVVLETRPGVSPFHTEATGDVRTYLSAESQQEPSISYPGQIPSHHGCNHRRTGKRHGDCCSKVDVGTLGPGQCQRQKGVILGLGAEKPVISGLYSGFDSFSRCVGRRGWVIEVDLHDSSVGTTSARPVVCGP